MKSINPILTFSGNAEQAFAFYRSVFGGEFTSLMRWREAPFADRVAAADREKIMHVALPLTAGSVLMGGDASASAGHPPQPGGNVTICIEPDSEAEAGRLFAALAEGGMTTMPLQKAFWGALNGMCTDRFGTQWMVNYTLPK
jgi:PhnB protein